MKITGLITEYNPFHNGHLYHLEESRRLTGADYCIALMSGSFVQRGAPAVYDKYVRTRMALQAGVDLVIEMPVLFSTSSAQEFAAYGIALFTRLGVDSVCFGSECGGIEPLWRIAGLFAEEQESYSLLLQDGLKRGMTYPESRVRALASGLDEEELQILNSPNNILGIEYCRAALRMENAPSLYTIKRIGSGYHDRSASGTLGSATAIRQSLGSGKNPDLVKSLVPSSVYGLMLPEIPLFTDDFSALLNFRILTEPRLEPIADISPELANRIRRSALAPSSFEERIQSLKSRQYTYTRVSRALLHLLLNIQAHELSDSRDAGYAPYARILGFRKESASLLTELKKRSSIPLITKLADASSLLTPSALPMLEQEILASHLYQIVKTEKGCAFKNEYTQPIIRI